MKYLILLLLLSTPALAEVSLSAGIGKGALYHNGTPFERSAAIGYQYNFKHDFFIRPEVGWFMDNSGNGKTSFWAAPLLGVSALSTVGPELHVALGPGYLQHPDEILGGHFQFSLEGGVGITSKNAYVGLAWKHLSSGGITQPNRGRDFIMVQLRLLQL